MLRSRRSTLLLTVATLALPVALGACSSLATTPPLRAGMQPPSGGTMEPIGEAASVDAARLMRIAKATEAAGDLGNAAAMYQRAVALDPTSIEAQLALADAFRRLGVPENAAHAYRAVLARQPDNMEARKGLGTSLIALTKPEEALFEFDAMIAADPLDPRGYNGRGVALSMAGRFDDARESFLTGLKLAPDDLQLNNNLARSYILSGRPAEAIPLLKRLASRPDAPPRVYENLAIAERSAADAVRVSDLDPPADQSTPQGVLYQAPPATTKPPETSGGASLEPVASTKPIASAPEPAATDVRQAASLIEEFRPRSSPAQADPGEIPPDAASPAAGLSDTGAAPRINPIDAVASGAAPMAALPHPSASAIPSAASPFASIVRRTGEIDEPSSIGPSEVSASAPAQVALPPDSVDATQNAGDVEPSRAGLPVAANGVETSETQSSPTADPANAAPRAVTAAFPAITPSAGPTSEPEIAAAMPQRAASTDSSGDQSDYRVQLAAERSKEIALERWQHLAATASDLLGGLSPFISKTSGGGGTLYRLRTNLMPRTEAEALCAALSDRDIQCYPAAIPRGVAATVDATPAGIEPAAGDVTPRSSSLPAGSPEPDRPNAL